MNYRKFSSTADLGRFHPFAGDIFKRYQSFRVPFSERRVILITGDFLSLVLAISVSLFLTNSSANIGEIIYPLNERWPLVIIFVLWFAISSLNDLYDIPTAHKRTLSLARIVITTQISLLIFLPITFLLPFPYLPLATLLALIFALPIVFTWRLVYRSMQSLATFNHRVLIVGQGKQAALIGGLLKGNKDLNFDVLGYVAEKDPLPEAETTNLKMLGYIDDLPTLIRKFWAHEIVIAVDKEIDSHHFQYISKCQARGVRVTSMADFYARLERKIPLEYIGTNWVLQALQDRAIFRRLQLMVKRFMDLFLLLLGLPILALLIIPLILIIRLDSPGPVFYRQIRSGIGGKQFWILKFRTMIADAEKAGKPQWATENDPRITRVGHFLRKSRLDEVPQLINILRGEMSFIGPRPERPEFVDLLREQIPFYDTRMMIKPGLTGWAQVHYDYTNNADDALIKLQHDFFYIVHWTLWMDIYILFRTVAVVLKLKGL